MVMVAQHASLQISIEALTFWNMLLKNEAMGGHPSLASLFPQMLAACDMKDFKIPYELSDAERAGYPAALHVRIAS